MMCDSLEEVVQGADGVIVGHELQDGERTWSGF